MALIVELFGPPGSGKTTFAKALAGRLRAQGLEVGVHLSARPGETEGGGPPSAGFSRIVRPIWELLAARPSAFAQRKPDPAEQLSPLLARFGRIKQLRMKQYLIRLSAARAKVEANPGVFIFDQGYLQFVTTVLAMGAEARRSQVSETLRAVPPADVALHIAAPPGELAQRLNLRLRNVGALGRFLEAGAGSSEAYLLMSDLVQDELERSGATVLRTRSPNDESFSEELERAALAIERVRKPAQPALAS
jgi:energy-coupling factor transporter ATP-binding protein EcfA2